VRINDEQGFLPRPCKSHRHNQKCGKKTTPPPLAVVGGCVGLNRGLWAGWAILVFPQGERQQFLAGRRSDDHRRNFDTTAIRSDPGLKVPFWNYVPHGPVSNARIACPRVVQCGVRRRGCRPDRRLLIWSLAADTSFYWAGPNSPAFRQTKRHGLLNFIFYRGHRSSRSPWRMPPSGRNASMHRRPKHSASSFRVGAGGRIARMNKKTTSIRPAKATPRLASDQ